MTTVNLSARDINVLEKIRDPESDPQQRLQLDANLPQDPHIRDPDVLKALRQQEQAIIQRLQLVEARLAKDETAELRHESSQEYQKAIDELGQMITSYPAYASARNNRAQAIRRLLGDSILCTGPAEDIALGLSSLDDGAKQKYATLVLRDLDQCIELLAPVTSRTPISPNVARTLAAAHTQRAAIYHGTATSLSARDRELDVAGPDFAGMAIVGWKKLDFEQAASRDFAMGGRYGNEIARALAVGVNPTAKLCGEIVQNAMRQEYGESFMRRS